MIVKDLTVESLVVPFEALIVESPVTSIEPIVTSIESPITSIESPITSIESPITSIESPITSIEPIVTSIESPVAPSVVKKVVIYKFGKSKRMAIIYLRRTFSNIFLTLTDLTSRVIVCCTSGNSGVWGQKRKKRAALAIEKIVKSLSSYFKTHNIKKIRLVTRMKLNRYYYSLKKELDFLI